MTVCKRDIQNESRRNTSLLQAVQFFSHRNVKQNISNEINGQQTRNAKRILILSFCDMFMLMVLWLLPRSVCLLPQTFSILLGMKI